QPEISKPQVSQSQAQRDQQVSRGVVLRQLTEEEKVARSRALAGARVEELEARKPADEEAKRHAEEEAARRLEKKEAAAPVHADAAGHRRKSVNEEEEESGAKKGPGGKAAPKNATPARKSPEDRRRGKLTVTRALSDDDERVRSVAAYRRHLQRVNKGSQAQAAGPAGPREVTIPETISVAELANRMARRSVDVIKVLMQNGIMATVNDTIDADTAELVATEYGHAVKRVAESD